MEIYLVLSYIVYGISTSSDSHVALDQVTFTLVALKIFFYCLSKLVSSYSKKNYSEDLYIEFTIEYKNLATPYALLFGRGPASAHFEK